MKIRLFYLSLCLFSCLCAADIYAAQQLPFFVPQKVLNKMNQPEKLPPIEQMLPNNRQTPTAQNNSQKTPDENSSKQPAKIGGEKPLQTPQQTNRQPTILQSVQKIPAAETKQATEKKSPAVTINEPKTDITDKQPDTPKIKPQHKVAETLKDETKTKIEAKAKKTPAEAAANTPILNNSQRTFDDIIADYKRDALGISQGKPVNNPRLRDVLQDYSDKRHIL